MINLIPKNAKKKLHVEYWSRVVTVWFITWSVILFASAVVLFPPYVLISSQVDAYRGSVDDLKEKIEDRNKDESKMVRASQQATLAINEFSKPLISDYITLVEDLQGNNIELSMINLSHSNKGIEPINLQGIAADRRTLASFKDRLLADDKVSAVDLPISNLAQDVDIPFSITVTIINDEV